MDLQLCLTWRKAGAAGAWRQKVMKSAQRETVFGPSAMQDTERLVWIWQKHVRTW